MTSKNTLFAHYSSYIACFILALLAFMPALTHNGLPAGADIAAHFWRVFELQSQWEDKIFTASRWAEHFYYGYGAPTFQYTASGFYVVAGIIGNLPVIDDIWALKIAWFIGIYIGTCGIYTYANRRWGMVGALVSATAFTFAPALIGNEALGRGAFPVVWGMGWLAMSIALLDRYAHIRKGIGWTVFALFAMLWSHNLTAISGAGVILAWLIFIQIFKRASMPYLRGAILLFLLGCGITGFFWIPVFLGRNLVSLNAIPFNPHMQYQNHFYTVEQLFSGLQPYDFGLLIQPERFTIGIVTWVAVVGLGIIYIYRRGAPTANIVQNQKSTPYETFFWLIITLASLFLVLPQSQFLWDNIQTLQTFVFPARFLNITALGLAMLLGAGMSMIRWRWVASLLIAFLIVQGWHSTIIAWRDDFPTETTPRDYLYYEFETNDLATTSANEFKPRTVPNLPPATGFLVDSLINGTPAMRLNPDAYGEGVIFTPLKSTAEEYIVEISSPTDLSLEIFQFYFVGWLATLDNQPIDISPSGDFGFIRTETIPAGSHILRLHYGLTNSDKLGWVLSIIAFTSTAMWMVYAQWMKMIKLQKSTFIISPTPLREIINLLLPALLIVAVLAFFVIREGVAWLS